MLLLTKKQARTLDQLRAIPVPEARPWGGTGECTWRPVQHGQLVDTLLAEVGRAGLRCKSTAWAVNEGETDLFGSVVFEQLSRFDDRRVRDVLDWLRTHFTAKPFERAYFETAYRDLFTVYTRDVYTGD